MEGTSLSPENDVIIAALPDFLSETDLENELSLEFSIKEEMIEEVMQELYKEITGATSTCTETAGSPSLSGSSLTLPSLLSSSSPLFVNSGKGESCGASVSDSASSVMAGVEYTGAGVFGISAGDGESVELEIEEEEEEEGVLLGEEEVMMEVCDGVEFGDEWLEKLMGWGPVELEGWS